MSEQKTEYRKGGKGPVIQSRSVVINRGSTGGLGGMLGGGIGGGGRSMTIRQSYSGGLNLAPGVLGKTAHTGVTNVMQGREKEKKEMQGLNERFASYIEKVRFLEAQNKKLLEEIERLKKQKGYDGSDIKALYEDELKQARNVINDLSKEKADFDARLVGLQDRLDAEEAYRQDAEKRANDYKSRNDKMNNQLGELEGEVQTLRGRCDNLEDECQKLRETNKKQQEDLRTIRADLDNETACHINEANLRQSLEEELAFTCNVYDAEIKALKELVNQEKTQDARNYWQGELSKCVREIQQAYDQQLAEIKGDMEMTTEMRMRDLQAGVMRDSMANQQAVEESRKLRSKMNESGSELANLKADNARLNERVRLLEEELDSLNREYERYREETGEELSKLNAELQEMLKQMMILNDTKLNLELEIACYRKLLEGEERSLQQIVEGATGSRSKGGDALADMLQKSNISESRVTVQRSSKGHISFFEACALGGFVVVENTSTRGARGKPQNLKGWRITRDAAGEKQVEHIFKDEYELEPEQQIKIWAKASKKEAKSGDMVGDIYSWNKGPGKYTLYDDRDNVKAELTVKYTM